MNSILLVCREEWRFWLRSRLAASAAVLMALVLMTMMVFIVAMRRLMMMMIMIGVWGERALQSCPKREIGVAEIFEY